MTKHYVAVGLLIAFLSCAGMNAWAEDGIRVGVPAEQQQGVCTGVVRDASGETLPGASVVVKNANGTLSTNGTTTNLDGAFTVSNVPSGATIVVSFIGYRTVEVVWTGSPLNIVLKEDTEQLEEVVVIGYGTVKKADLTGAVSVVDNKSFKDQPVTRIEDALQGRMAGVNVVSDGIPGGSVKIRVRGTNSINKSNEPLYVVDGMVRESGLDGVNPEDIQNLQVLKDASSTAIYGSRGANGVVIVTTKSGMSGRRQIILDASVGISKASNLPDMLGTKEYAETLVKYKGISENDVKNFLNGTDPGVDWTDEIFRTGVTQNYKLVFTAGTDKMQSYVSGSYMDHKGVLENTQYQRYSAKVNVKANMADWLDLTVDINASHGKGKGQGGLSYGTNVMYAAFNSAPAMHLMTEDGKYMKDPYGYITDNPYGILKDDKQERRRDVFSGHVDLRFKLLPGLTFTTTNGIDYYNGYNYGFGPDKVYTARKGANVSNGNTQRTMLQTTNNLTYLGTWGKHNLTVTAVWEATKSQTRSMSISGSGLEFESLGWWNIAKAPTRDVSNNYSDWGLLSGVGRLMYNFDNRYMLTATIRADGSSRFTDEKWGYFPSVAVAWTASNEKFMEGVKDVMNNLKIRASYGVIGNQDIDPYSTIGLMGETTFYPGGTSPVTGYDMTGVPTPDLKWEKTKQFDLGVDLGFFGGRVDMNFDYFSKKTTDALLSAKRPDFLGGLSYLTNIGEVANKGFDLAITGHVVQTNDWDWTTTINGSYLKNEVKKMTADEPRIYADKIASVLEEATVTMEGEPIGAFYGVKWAGLDKEGYATYYDKDGKITRNPTKDDRVVLGKSLPTFTLGWNNTVRWKNLSLNAFFNASFGAKRYNLLRSAMCMNTGNSRTVTSPDRYKELGKSMPDPTLTGLHFDDLQMANSKWLESADYFRCENITLAYDLSKNITRFADVRFTLSVQNLFTISGYKGADPAGYSFGGSDRVNGIDTGAHPVPRTFTLGVRMNF